MRLLERGGLNRGTAGNASVRAAAGFLITPSGVKPEQLVPDSIVFVPESGGAPNDDARPSSEWRFHRDIYLARDDAGAVVHAHSTYATALACRRQDIPAFHYMVAVAGGHSIRCAPYATFGTQQLSDQVVEALDGRRACLLANHGMIALGGTLAGAIDLAVEVEELARQYALAVMLGKPAILSDEEMNEVMHRFEVYGAHRGGS
jgi:L-fuculose-phosphate aldolase